MGLGLLGRPRRQNRRAQWLLRGAEIVAGVQLVVAQLEEFVGVVVLPPGHVEGGAVGEVAALGVVFQGDVGYGAPAVVAGHVDAVEQEVGLDAEELAAGEPLGGEGLLGRLGRLGQMGRLGQVGGVGELGRHGLGGEGAEGHLLALVLAEDEHDARRAQLGEIIPQQTAPEGAALGGLQLGFQGGDVALRQVAVALRQVAVDLRQVAVGLR